MSTELGKVHKSHILIRLGRKKGGFPSGDFEKMAKSGLISIGFLMPGKCWVGKMRNWKDRLSPALGWRGMRPHSFVRNGFLCMMSLWQCGIH